MTKSKVKYLKGMVEGPKRAPLLNQHDAWKEDADCGCGIDCCNSKLVLKDTGTSNVTSLSFENGELIVTIEGVGKFTATLTAV
jgi:hypothetical protein